MSEYVQFDRTSDALSSLEELSSCLNRKNGSVSAWKYAIVSVHCALQGYMCIALHNGNSFLTWKTNQYKNWQIAYDSKVQLPDPQLDFFMELFDKLFPNSSPINRVLISWLNDTRNGLIHFNTDSYSIEKESIVRALREAIHAIKLTPSLTKGNFFYELSDNKNFDNLIAEIELKLST